MRHTATLAKQSTSRTGNNISPLFYKALRHL